MDYVGHGLAGRSVLVTGAAGFLGRAVVAAADAAGWAVWPVVHHATGFPREIVAEFDAPTFGQLVRELPRVDAVVHLGARVGWGGLPPAALLAPNVLASGHLAAWARHRGAYFVYASAAIVCGVQTPRIDAATPLHPDTAYGCSKWLGEETVRMAEVEGAILRFAGIFGGGGPSHLGLNRALQAATQGEVPSIHGDGEGRRNYIYVHDAAACIMTCLNRRVTGIHLAAGPAALTIAEMVQAICDEFLGGRPPGRSRGDPARDQVVVPSPDLPPGRDFRDALRDISLRAATCV